MSDTTRRPTARLQALAEALRRLDPLSADFLREDVLPVYAGARLCIVQFRDAVSWQTDCGEFQATSGRPLFCPFCGGHLALCHTEPPEVDPNQLTLAALIEARS